MGWRIAAEAVLRAPLTGHTLWGVAVCGCACCMLSPIPMVVAASIPARHLVVVAAAGGGCRVVIALIVPSTHALLAEMYAIGLIVGLKHAASQRMSG